MSENRKSNLENRLREQVEILAERHALPYWLIHSTFMECCKYYGLERAYEVADDLFYFALALVVLAPYMSLFTAVAESFNWFTYLHFSVTDRGHVRPR